MPPQDYKHVSMEKLEEMRQDMLIEQELRHDLDYAIEYLDNQAKLYDCIKHLEMLSNKLSLYGWNVTPKEIMEHIL